MKGRKGKLTVIVMAIWLCITGAFLFWEERDTRHEEKLLAQRTANAFFQQIVVSREWNASHSGVYVPITAKTQPNPHLPLPGRDLTADNGLKLTKLNPSYMTRQISELAKSKDKGIQFHLTSLKPINPENKPTKWEEKWLNSFEAGGAEQGEFFTEGTTTQFRYMAPLPADLPCLTCHARQGYLEDDILGGLSISLPYPAPSHFHIFAGIGSVAVLGLIFIFIGTTHNERKQRLFDATFNSPVPTSLTDKNHMILMANEAYWLEFGPLPYHQKSIKCYEHRPGKSCHTPDCPLRQIMSGAGEYAYESIKERAGICRHFIVTAKALHDARGKAMGIVESFQDITMRKRSEETLEKVNRQLEALSNIDGLTGIANRRRFDEVLAQEHARHARSGAKLSLILLDIDYFKSFNDCYGHVTGDGCLQQIAQMMADYAGRPADLTARYGGEEFACILPETDHYGALAVAENIRQGIMALDIPHHESRVATCVTASLGVVTVLCCGEESPVALVAQADKLLYRAKSSGRNRVESLRPLPAEKDLKGNVVQLVWKEAFCCGNQLIDAQHHSLFGRANELLAAVLSARPSSPAITALISRLLDEVSQHFHDEELILTTVGFSGIDQHSAEHAQLLTRGRQLAEEFQTSTLRMGDLLHFLAYDMVLCHMLETDQDFFGFLTEADAAAVAGEKDR